MRANNLVFFNGSIYRGAMLGPRAEALAVRDGQIAHVGGFAECCEVAGPNAEKVDMQGGTLLPSFVDAHAHPVEGFLLTCDADLGHATTGAAIMESIAACARDYPQRQWVLAANADLQIFEQLPTRKELDCIVLDRPLLVIGNDLHCGCLNSAALRELGVGHDTPDPPGGLYERSEETGEPTGVVHESALYQVFPRLPQLEPGGVCAAIRKGRTQAHRYGITGWFDAVVSEYLLKGYGQAADSDELGVYVSTGLLASPHAPAREQIETFIAWRERFNRSPLHVHTVKIFLDGTVEGATAAMLEPYLDTGGNFTPLWEPEALFEMVELADRAGFDLHFHTIGDKAVRCALDAMARVIAVCPYRDRRPQLCHIDLIHDDDVPRFNRTGCIANIQAYWTPFYALGKHDAKLGPLRMKQNYRFRDLRNAGAMLVGGSDWPVTTMNPLAAIQRALTRSIEGAGEAWLPDQTLDLPLMLDAYTTNAAWGLRFDRHSGCLSPGKDASLVVLDANLFETAAQHLSAVEVRQTYFKGRRVYGAHGWR